MKTITYRFACTLLASVLAATMVAGPSYAQEAAPSIEAAPAEEVAVEAFPADEAEAFPAGEAEVTPVGETAPEKKCKGKRKRKGKCVPA